MDLYIGDGYQNVKSVTQTGVLLFLLLEILPYGLS